jgi:hypothetical protein
MSRKQARVRITRLDFTVELATVTVAKTNPNFKFDIGHASCFGGILCQRPYQSTLRYRQPPIYQPTMATTKIPRYSMLLQMAHYAFLILAGLYVLLLVLGGTPFMQRQYACHLHSSFSVPHPVV